MTRALWNGTKMAAKMTALQMDFGGMKVVDDGRAICLENRPLVECLNVAGDAQREGDFQRADEVLRQVVADYSPRVLPVDILCPLTIRTLRVFANHNIVTVADLIQSKLSDVRDWYNLGTVSISFLGERMRAFGFNLAAQNDHAWIKSLNNRQSKRLDRLLLLPAFLVDPGYSQDHVLKTLSKLADWRASYTLVPERRSLTTVPGQQANGLGLICDETALDPMAVLRLLKDLVARKLIDESTPGTFTITKSGLQMAKQAAKERAKL